jgi:hypothetical protein
MWILVLTILGWTNQSGQAVTGIPGFTSEAACTAAANAWLKNTDEKGNNAYKRAVCVRA